MKIDGRCHCGAITFEAELDPEAVGICHCTDCQTLTSSAFRIVGFVPEADFRLLTGKPKDYIKTAESGAKRNLTFCPDCGTAIYATTADNGEPKVYGVRMGAVVQRDQFPPKRQVWHRSATPWLADLAAVPAQEKQ